MILRFETKTGDPKLVVETPDDEHVDELVVVQYEDEIESE